MAFTPDGRHTIYAAMTKDAAWVAVVDGEEGPAYREVLYDTLSITDSGVRYLAVNDDNMLVRVTHSWGG